MKKIIFGDGLYGKVLAHILTEQGQSIEGMMTSRGYSSGKTYEYTVEKNSYSIPIMELGDENYSKDDSEVIVTVISARKIIIDNLKKNGYKNIIVAEEKFGDYLDEYFHRFFCKYGTSLDDEIIDLYGVRIYNPTRDSLGLRNNFYGTVVDEVFDGAIDNDEFLVEGPYEYGDVVINKDDVVIDAGANIGLFACYAAFRGCKVYACEPDKTAQSYLRKQRDLYKEGLINIVNYALADKKGKLNFVEDENSAVSALTTDNKGILVDAISIDELVKELGLERVDYIKADIEGAERYMLMGAKNVLRKFGPKLSICTYHLKDDPEVLEKIIKEANPKYKVIHRWKKLYAYIP